MELYLRSIDRRWRKELGAQPPTALAFSPYITPTTGESILTKLEGGKCDVYTRFEADLFASGASSIATLKKLLHHGHGLFHLPELHAKIVLIPERFASVGSQNITHRGIRNREATVAIDDPATIQEIQKLVMPWMRTARPITEQMLSDMESLLPPLKLLYKKAQEAAAAANVEVELQRVQREKEQEQRREQYRERVRRLRALRAAIDRADHSRSTAVGEVQYASEYRETKSLIFDRMVDLTKWSVGNRTLSLLRTHRYLCVMEETGKIGWARVMKKRITFIEDGVLPTEMISLNGRLYKLSLNATWPPLSNDGQNMEVHIISPSGYKLCTVHAVFALDSLTVLGVIRPKSADRDWQAEQVSEWIAANDSEFISALLPILLHSFRYKSNLRGVQANQFFGELGSKYRVRALLVNGSPVLAAKRVWT